MQTNDGNKTQLYLLGTFEHATTTFNHTDLSETEFVSYQMRVKNSKCEGPLNNLVTYTTLSD